MILLVFYVLCGGLIAWFLLVVRGFFLLSSNVSTYNKFFGIFGLASVFIVLLLILLSIVREVSLIFNGVLIAFSLNLPVVVVGLLILVSTGLVRAYRKRNASKVSYFKEVEERTMVRIESMSKVKIDSLRKVNHVLIFVGLLAVWSVSLSVVVYNSGTSAGMIPLENNMLLIYVQLITNSKPTSEILFGFGWFYYILFFFFYSFCFIMLANEFTRKNPQYTFPFNYLSRLLLSEDEKQGYGSYLYFAIGQMFAAFFCPPMVFYAILGMSSIGDLMASQVGIRYGKHQIRWNPHKTWEGTIAATIFCFLTCFFFIGFIWSVIFSTTFMVLDIVTGKGFKNINASDNLLIPIACALLYIAIRFFFNLDYFTIILTWF